LYDAGVEEGGTEALRLFEDEGVVAEVEGTDEVGVWKGGKEDFDRAGISGTAVGVRSNNPVPPGVRGCSKAF